MRKAALFLLPLVAACASTPGHQQAPSAGPPPPQAHVVPPSRPQEPAPQGFVVPQVQRVPGLEGVIEKDGTALLNLFGPPRLDVKEGDMRKLQFAGQACVLDVFLYPMRPNAEPVATWVDARRASDGLDVDRAACIAALRKR